MERILIYLSFVLLPASSYASCIVAQYPFNGNANDVTGNGYDATVFGAVLTEDRFGNPNSAYEFNGSSNYIRTYSTFDFQYRTVSVWAMMYDTDQFRVILTQDANSLDYGAVSTAAVDGNIRGRAGGTGSGSGAEYVQNNYETNKWYHIVLVRNADSTFYYLNGQLVFSYLANGEGSVAGANEEFLIGVSRTLNSRFFYGKIDDIKIFNCALGQAAVEDLYVEQAQSPSCLLADYPFDGNTLDVTGNGYDATAFGPQLAHDRFGSPYQAYEFDGINDLIRSYSTFDFETRSVSAWFKPYDQNIHQTVLTQDAHTLDHGSFHIAVEDGSIKARAGGTGTVTLSNSYLVGQWYHVVLVRKEDVLQYYLNGELVVTGVPNSEGSFDGSNEEFLIGVARTMSSRFFHGMIDDIKIYDCALEPDQVAELFDGFDGLGSTDRSSPTQLSLYPNPTNGAFRIVIQGEGGIEAASLFDLQGRLVRQVLGMGVYDLTIDAMQQPPGVYLVQVKTVNGKTSEHRLVVAP